MSRMRWRSGWPLVVVMLLVAACGPSSDTAAGGPDEATAAPSADTGTSAAAGTVRLYTSVTEDTVEAVLDVVAEAAPDVDVELFRAPTGELNARLAAEQRAGAVEADVLWLTDPLSMYAYDEQGLLAGWTPEGAAAVPAPLRTERFWGTRILNLVIVVRDGLDPLPTGWHDLADPAYADAVAIPDPAFAGSSFAALGYLALDDDFGFDYYRDLVANGAVQVPSPTEVITGVAEGRFAAGMSLDKSARDAIDDGAPIAMVWPEPGAIALYSPVAVVAGGDATDAAEAFVEVVLGEAGQEAIASTGWQPVLPGVGGPPIPTDAEQVFPDFADAFGRQDALLEGYRSIVGG